MPEPFTRSSRSQPAARWPDRPRSSRPRSTETGRQTEPRPDHPGHPEPATATATATAGSTAASIQSCNLETSCCDDRRPPSQFLVKFQAEQKNASSAFSQNPRLQKPRKKQKDSWSNSRKKYFSGFLASECFRCHMKKINIAFSKSLKI